MTGDGCAEMRLLVQADVDGELSPAEAARVAAHVEGCAGCAGAQASLLALSVRLRREAPYHAASDALRAAVRARIAAPGAAAPVATSAAASVGAHRPASAPVAAVPRLPWRQRPGRLPQGWRQGWNLGRPLGPFAPFGAGFALAACLALLLVLPRGGGLPDDVVASHIRALQPGHLLDVASTDQHTVKPWFDGRLDYAPPVKDLKAEGFPLAGGRLDYLAGRPVAALAYQRRQHVVQLYAWPDGSHLERGPAEGSRSGYNWVRWSRDGMAFWAVSDLNAAELADFVRHWQAA